MSGSTNLFCKEATYDLQAMGKGIQKAALRLPEEERERALGYYAELYGDKLDAGVSESEIVREFGDPEGSGG